MEKVLIEYLKQAFGTVLTGSIVAIILYVLLPILFKKIGKYVNGNVLDNISNGIGTIEEISKKFDKDPLHDSPLEKVLKYSHMIVQSAAQYFKITGVKDKKEINILRKDFARKYSKELYEELLKISGEKREVTDKEMRLIDGSIEAAVAFAKKKELEAGKSSSQKQK